MDNGGFIVRRWVCTVDLRTHDQARRVTSVVIVFIHYGPSDYQRVVTFTVEVRCVRWVPGLLNGWVGRMTTVTVVDPFEGPPGY